VREQPFRGIEAVHEVEVEYIDNWVYPATDFVIWEVEQVHGAEVVSSLAMPHIDDERLELDPPELLQAFLYANQWSAVNQLSAKREQDENAENKVRLVSPWQSAVQVEEYQLFPVLKAMQMPRISMLLADDVGLGKTIEAGLILAELYVRRRIRRVLIVCPASLQLQWRAEMQEKFHLDFTIVDREETFRLQRELGPDSNPWLSYPRIITSMDYLRQKDILESFRAATDKLAGRFEDIMPWQMLVVDEVHNLAPSRYGDISDRCDMLRQISPWFEHRLFLSATPHNGYTLSFTGLLELLDPVRFQQKTELDENDHKQIGVVMVRRLKSDLTEEGEPDRFANRKVEKLDIVLHEPERALFAALQTYRKALHRLLRTRGKNERHLGEFLIKLLTKRLLSSSYAFARTWWQHVEGLDLDGPNLEVMEHSVNRAEAVISDDEERGLREEDAIKQTGAWLRRYAHQLKTECQEVSNCLTLLGWSKEALQQPLRAVQLPPDARWDRLQKLISDILRDGPQLRKDERLIIFTEYKHTLEYLVERLRREERLETPVVECLYGGATSKVRDRIKDAFNDPADPLRILVGTDTVSEGINLQATCRNVLHQDIPWNPMRMEQRNGRVDRHGQEQEVRAYHFASAEKDDLEFMAGLVVKVEQAREDLGSVGQVIDRSLEEYFTRGTLSQQDVENRFEQARRETKAPTDMQAADRGKSMVRSECVRARQRLDETERSLELSHDNVRKVLERVVRREDGTLKKEATEDVYTFDVVPPTWRKLVKETMERARGTSSSGRAKMVFDPDYFIKTVLVDGYDTGRTVFKPRNDRILIRLGHPLMQRAIGVLRRRMWEVRGDHRDISRWTVWGSDRLPHGVDVILLVNLFLEITNEFREVAHQEVRCYAFEVHGPRLDDYRAGLVSTLEQRFPLSSAVQERKVPEIRELWLEHDPNLREFIQSERDKYQEDFRKRMQQRRREEETAEKRALALRLRELDRMKEPRELAKLRKENEQLARIVARPELSPSLFPEIQQRWVREAAEARLEMEENEWRMHAENYIERMKGLVNDEQQRILNKVLPKRYALATVDIQPLTVEYIVRARREERV
jgi:superfamily II DNA or RNA helicase